MDALKNMVVNAVTTAPLRVLGQEECRERHPLKLGAWRAVVRHNAIVWYVRKWLYGTPRHNGPAWN